MLLCCAYAVALLIDMLLPLYATAPLIFRYAAMPPRRLPPLARVALMP